MSVTGRGGQDGGRGGGGAGKDGTRVPGWAWNEAYFDKDAARKWPTLVECVCVYLPASALSWSRACVCVCVCVCARKCTLSVQLPPSVCVSECIHE